MKTVLASVAILAASAAFAQSKPVFEEDTLRYKGQKFYVGKEFQVGTGSAADKTFVSIYRSNANYTDVKPLYPVFANTKFIVEKIYNATRGWSIQTHLPDPSKKDGKGKGEIVFFVVQHAVDTKEVID